MNSNNNSVSFKIKLLFVEQWESDFNGNHYVNYRFIDLTSLTPIVGTNLDVNLKLNTSYDCDVVFRDKKFKVVKVYI